MSRSAPDGLPEPGLPEPGLPEPGPAEADPPEADQAGDGSTADRWPSHDWRLLVGLPGRVLAVALAGQSEDPKDRVRAAVAGLEAIAAGRLFDSDLVRTVANAIYAESGSRVEAGGACPGHGEAGGACHRHVEASGGNQEARELAEVLSACRAAADLLGQRADPADSAAYRQWVQSVAARTAGSASGHVTDLGRALGLTPET